MKIVKFIIGLLLILSFFVFADFSNFENSLNSLDLFDSDFTAPNPSLSTGNLYLSEKIASISDNINLVQDINLIYSSYSLHPTTHNDFKKFETNTTKPLYYASPSEFGIGWNLDLPYIEARPNTFSDIDNDWYLYKLYINGNRYELILNFTSTEEEEEYREYKTREYSNLIIRKYGNYTDSYWKIIDTEGNEYLFEHQILNLLPSYTEELPEEFCNQETCGRRFGLSEESYRSRGYWHHHYTVAKASDSNWTTYAMGYDGAILDINYTKPYGVLPETSVWKVKADGIPMLDGRIANLSIPNSCWEQETLQLRIRVQNEYIEIPSWNETIEIPVYGVDGRFSHYEIEIIEHSSTFGYNSSTNFECFTIEEDWENILRVQLPTADPLYGANAYIYEETFIWHLNLEAYIDEELAIPGYNSEVGFSNSDSSSSKDQAPHGTQPTNQRTGEWGPAPPTFPSSDICGLYKNFKMSNKPSNNYFYVNYISKWEITQITDKYENNLKFEYEDIINIFNYSHCSKLSPVYSYDSYKVPDEISNNCRICSSCYLINNNIPPYDPQWEGLLPYLDTGIITTLSSPLSSPNCDSYESFCNDYHYGNIYYAGRIKTHDDLLRHLFNPCGDGNINTISFSGGPLVFNGCCNFPSNPTEICKLYWAHQTKGLIFGGENFISMGCVGLLQNKSVEYTQSSRISKISTSYGQELEFNYEELPWTDGYCFRGFEYHVEKCHRLESVKQYLNKSEKTLIQSTFFTYDNIDLTEHEIILKIDELKDPYIKEKIGEYEYNSREIYFNKNNIVKNVSLLSKIDVCSDEDGEDCILVSEFKYYDKGDDEFLGLIKSTKNINGGVRIFDYKHLEIPENISLVHKDYISDDSISRLNEPTIIFLNSSFPIYSIVVDKIIEFDPISKKSNILNFKYNNPKITNDLLPIDFIFTGDVSDIYWRGVFKGGDKQEYYSTFFNTTEITYLENGKQINYFYTGADEHLDYAGDLIKGVNYKTELFSNTNELVYSMEKFYSFNEKSSDPRIYSILLNSQVENRRGYIQENTFEYNELDQPIISIFGMGDNIVKTHTKYLWESNPEITNKNFLNFIEYQAIGDKDTSREDLLNNNFKVFESISKNNYAYIDTPDSLSLISSEIYNKKTNKFIKEKEIDYLYNGLIQSLNEQGIITEFLYTPTNLLSEKYVHNLGTEKMFYNDKDLLIKITDINNADARYIYDDFNRIKEIYIPSERLPYKTFEYIPYSGYYSNILIELSPRKTRSIEVTTQINPSTTVINQRTTEDNIITTKNYYGGFGKIFAKDMNKGDCNFDDCTEVLRYYTEYDFFGNVLKQSKPISVIKGDINYKFPEDIEFIENKYSKDPLTELIKTYDYSGTLINENKYFGTGNLLIEEIKDALGRTTKTTKDALGRTIKTEDALGRELFFEYGSITENLIKYTDSLDRKTRNVYDFRGNVIYSNDPDRGYITNFYDEYGKLIYSSSNNFIIDSGFELEEERYFNFRNLLPIYSSSVSYSSDCYSGKCMNLNYPLTLNYLYEIPINPNEKFILGGYTKGNGVLFKLDYLDSNFNSIDFIHVGTSSTEDWSEFSHNLTAPTNTQYIKLNLISFGRVSLDNLYLTPNKGEKIEYDVFYTEYDNLNRPLNLKTIENKEITKNIYGGSSESLLPTCPYGVGKICAQISDNQIIQFEYDEKGLIKEQTITNFLNLENSYSLKIENTFDFATLDNRKLNNKNIDYMYDKLGRLININFEDKKISDFEIDDQNRLNSIIFGNDITTQYKYDVNNRLTEIKTQSERDYFFGERYTYDSMSNIIALDRFRPSSPSFISLGETSPSIPYSWENTARFRYDDVDRIIDVFSRDERFFKSISYGYDNLDNRLYSFSIDENIRYTYNFPTEDSVTLERVNKPEGSYIFKYDNMNRLISKTFEPIDYTGTLAPIGRGAPETESEKIYDITYDNIGNLKTINGSFGNETYYYSLDGKRIIKNINDEKLIFYFWEGDRTIYEIETKLIETELLTSIGLVELNKGWNIISSDVFKELNPEEYVGAYSYDSSGKYIEIKPKSDISTFEGIWVNLKKPSKVLFESKPSEKLEVLKNSVNLIGFNSQEDIKIFANAITDSEVQIYRIDSLTGRYNRVYINELEVGKGYWIYSSVVKSLKPPISTEASLKEPLGMPSKPLITNLPRNETFYINNGVTLISRIDYEIEKDSLIFPKPTIYFYHNDHRLNPRVITDENASIVMKTDYEVFGAQLNLAQEIENRKDFVGHEQDSSGLQYFGARFYDPDLGRFISPDPIKDGLNPFVYAQNNPMKYVDLNGNDADLFMKFWKSQYYIDYEDWYNAFNYGGTSTFDTLYWEDGRSLDKKIFDFFRRGVTDLLYDPTFNEFFYTALPDQKQTEIATHLSGQFAIGYMTGGASAVFQLKIEGIRFLSSVYLPGYSHSPGGYAAALVDAASFVVYGEPVREVTQQFLVETSEKAIDHFFRSKEEIFQQTSSYQNIHQGNINQHNIYNPYMPSLYP